jgi:hypothetical protein
MSFPLNTSPSHQLPGCGHSGNIQPPLAMFFPGRLTIHLWELPDFHSVFKEKTILPYLLPTSLEMIDRK